MKREKGWKENREGQVWSLLLVRKALYGGVAESAPIRACEHLFGRASSFGESNADRTTPWCCAGLPPMCSNREQAFAVSTIVRNSSLRIV